MGWNMFNNVCIKRIVLTGLTIATLITGSLSYSETTDSTKLTALNGTVKVQKYQSYIDFNNCIATPKKVFAVVAGFGGGTLDQACPSDHPVMTQWKQWMMYTSAVPYLGAVMGAGGDNSIVCCAMAHRWVSAA